ncbi:hypothetical protein Fot_18625 [Forsythia ovata]|uniref:Uncharacterized protein n=1 Tax=Forsythia ovata TaxID=205694 RepID=A0ABD1VIQ7_9LAMI
MDIWSWICELPDSNEWSESNSPQTFLLAASKPTLLNKTSVQTIELRAERTFGSDSESFLTFSIRFLESNTSSAAEIIIWTSDPCPLASDKPFLPLILQLLQEIVSRSPTAHDNTCPRSQIQKLKPEPVSWILDSHLPESFSNFFNFIFLAHLFWLCACDAPSEIGSLYFHSLLAPNLETFSRKAGPVLRNFFIAVGTDVEICFMRTFGYIAAKWLVSSEVEVGLQSLALLPSHNLGFSYAMESHGLWILKGYSPVKSMQMCSNNARKNYQFPSIIEAKESVLKYALAHQQIEAVMQLEYTVGFNDGFIQVNARVDNLRLHVVKLGFKKNDMDGDWMDEKYFPSRVRVWVGPEVGASYVGGLSLGRSTDNMEREMEMQKSLKGTYGKSKVPKMKTMARMASRTKMKNWRWDQDAEGNAATFDGILCDNTTGVEIAMWKPLNGGGVQFQKRYTGGSRAFTKSGGLIFSGEEYKDGVRWRLSKEMEGSVLKWRIGAQVWLTYLPNDVNSSYYETRCIEWCDEVDLPLIPIKY